MRRTPLDEGRRWLEQAEVDLGWARHLSEQGAHHLACFLAQQVAGKALKAFLYSRGAEVVLGHSVERLCAEASRAEPLFKEGCSRWSALDGFYVPTRYPNSLPDSIPAKVFTRSAADQAVGHAHEVVEGVRRQLRSG
jgi:HEPN domain-containing protein